MSSSPAARPAHAFPRTTAYGNGRPPENGNHASTGLVVRSHSGVGEFAEFDPRTGALRSGAIGQVSGLYGNVGDLSMVFYRDGGRLLLHTGERLIDLDTHPIGVHWQPADDQTTRFVLSVDGVIVCDVYYRAVMSDLDFGLLIRDVLTDPARRTRIFTA
ncbi:hypothetical protein AB0C65_13345 [Nocardia sp. NPDC048505]